MPELDRAQNAVPRLCGRPGRLSCGQRLRELVQGIAEQGSDHHETISKTSGLAKEGETRFCNGPVAGAADGWCSE